MNRRLSKSKKEYIDSGGWSSHYFFQHALYVFGYYENLGYTFDIGRHVIYLEGKDSEIILKFYVHYAGRDRKHLTITDSLGTELLTVTYDISPEDLCKEIDKLLIA